MPRAATRFPALEPIRPPAIADQVFDALYEQVVTLALLPGARLSEVAVARRFGVSRQPVRDAFSRLSTLGFLTIRPQRATTVSAISERAVLEARFVRVALEVEVMRAAAAGLSAGDLAALAAVLDAQAAAVAAGDKPAFHALDDRLHREICERAGVGFAWTLIREKKAHMDRVRFLALTHGLATALEEHRRIHAALEARDPDAAVAALRSHLGRIDSDLPRLRDSHGQFFAGT